MRPESSQACWPVPQPQTVPTWELCALPDTHQTVTSPRAGLGRLTPQELPGLGLAGRGGLGSLGTGLPHLLLPKPVKPHPQPLTPTYPGPLGQDSALAGVLTSRSQREVLGQAPCVVQHARWGLFQSHSMPIPCALFCHGRPSLGSTCALPGSPSQLRPWTLPSGQCQQPLAKLCTRGSQAEVR